MARRRRGGLWDPVRRLIGRAYLRLGGWRVEGPIPNEAKYVVIAAPHTSYWDFMNMMAFGFATGQYISFLMKASIFVGPLGAVLRGMGGVPVDRSGAHGLVESVVLEFERRDELIVVIAPEGTRGRREHWKSGFYHVAEQAGVPIALGFLDYGSRVVGYGPLYWPGSEGCEELLKTFYADKRGLYPDQHTPPSLPDLRTQN